MDRSDSATLQVAEAWQEAESTTPAGRSRASTVLGGSMVMLAGTMLVSLLNFLYNFATARLLGPAEFSHANAFLAMLMLFSAMTLSYQLVCAKFIARNASEGAKGRVYRGMLRSSWKFALLTGLVLSAASPLLASYLRLPSAWMIVLLAGGIACYIPLGVKRGALQGLCRFPALTGNFILEAAVKFGAVLLLLKLGYGVFGVVAALTASVALAYAWPGTTPRLHDAPETAYEPASFREGMQATVFFIGQVVINNADVLLVKHFFSAREAGMYGGVALVGRLLYFAAWSVVNAMFPVSASAESAAGAAKCGDGRASRFNPVLVLPLALVTGMSVLFIAVTGFFPNLVVRCALGAGYREVGPLLWIYAAKTGIYAVAAALTAYEMSRRIANTTWVQLAAGILMAAGIEFFHADLHQVIMVQMAAMLLLLAAVLVPFLHTHGARRVGFEREVA